MLRIAGEHARPRKVDMLFNERGEAVRILIVDDHPLFGDGLAALIERQRAGVVIERADSCQAALRACVDGDGIPRRFDLVFLDLTLPDSSGKETLLRFRNQTATPPVVVISADESPVRMRECLAAGAMGYIPKTASRSELTEAVVKIMKGRLSVPDWARDDANLPARAAGRPVRLSDLGLTPRQILVFTLVVQGKPNKVISRELGISESTIKKHVSPVLRTLGVTDRLQAIITLSRRGIALD